MTYFTYESHRAARQHKDCTCSYCRCAKTETSTQAEALRIAANALKNFQLRVRVQAVLIAGLENADDTVADGYGAQERKEYPTREAFWAMMFESSAQDYLSRVTDKRVHRFFNLRGIRA